QAENQRAPTSPEPRRAARLEREPPELLLDAELGETRTDVVVRAYRDAAAHDGDVDAVQRLLGGLARLRCVVACSAGAEDLRAAAAGERRDRERARVADRARPRRLVQPEQLVAGHEHRDAGAAHAADQGAPE